jgi:hypothetical protein
LLRWLAKRQALSQNLLSLRHLRPCGWGRASETIRPQCSQRLSSSAEVTSQYICGYMALSKLSNAQILRGLIGSARQLALSCCIAGRHSGCVVLSTLCPAICRPVHRYSSSGQTSRSLSTAKEDEQELIEAATERARLDIISAKAAIERVEQDLARMSRERLLPDDKTLEKVSRYEAHLSRLFHKSVHELEALQTRRKGGVAPLARLDVDGLAEN